MSMLKSTLPSTVAPLEEDRLLEDDAAIGDRPRDRPPGDGDAPRARRGEADDHAQQRGLAAAGRADDRDELAVADREIHPVDGDDRLLAVAEHLPHAVEDDAASGPRPSRRWPFP